MIRCRFATKYGWCDLDQGTTCDGDKMWCAQYASSAHDERAEEATSEDSDEVWVTGEEVSDDDRTA